MRLKGPARPGGGASFWALDTDGSVLVAVAHRGARSTVYDCVLPSGACTRLSPLVTESGDPEFVGNDM